jgi:cytochrome P450
VSIRDPSAVKQIYGTERFIKSNFYDVFKIDVRRSRSRMGLYGVMPLTTILISKGHESIFSTQSTLSHGRFRRVMAPGFSQATLDGLEDIFMDDAILLFLDKMGKKADKNELANMFKELHLLAFDVLGELAFGKSFDMVKMNDHPFTSWLKVQ